MPNIKSKPTRNFTTIRNSMIRDKNLKCMDRGMLVTLLSYGKNWKFSIKGLSTQMPDSEESIRKSLIRLEKAGYLVRTKIYENGRIVYNDYTFKDEKLTDEEISMAKNSYKRKSEPISDTIASEDINDDKMAVFAYDRKEVEKILYNNVSLRKLELFLADKYQGDYDFDKKEADAILNIIINEISSTKPYTMIKGERIPRNIVADTLIKADTDAVMEALDKVSGAEDISNNGASGDGTTVIIKDSTITTTGSGSGGIMTTGGGITKAYDLTVTTSGQSSAPIRTDRGGGTVTVDGGTYTSNGLGSPVIYSTADITVDNAALVSNLSEGVCIEGLNSITLNNCDMTANNTKCNGNATFMDSIMIYQSMSGDADSGTSSFTMNGGSLTSKNGHVFHVTNTNAVITLSDVTIKNEDSENVLISVCDDGWSGGSNTATLNAAKQTLEGAVLVGDNSTLTLSLTDGSTFKGYINGKITNANGDTVSTEVGTVSVTLDSTSTWTLTGDSYVTEFNGDAANVISNGYTLYVNGTALSGTK